MKDLAKKFLNETGATLVESLVSLVLLTAIIMPLVWYFMSSTNFHNLEESGEIERFMYEKLINNQAFQDSVRIDTKMYYVETTVFEEKLTIQLFDKSKVKVYEKTIIK